MNASETSLRVPGREMRRFAPYHPWDGNFFLLGVALIWLGIVLAPCRARAQGTAEPAYLNPDLPPRERAQDLVRRMTLPEKVSQLVNGATVAGLGIAGRILPGSPSSAASSAQVARCHEQASTP